MKSKQFPLILGMGVVLVGMATSASADLLEVAPMATVILPSDESGKTKVALSFSLSELRTGTGRVIDEAYVEWLVPNVPADELVEFAIHEIEEGWTATGVSSGMIPDTKEAEESVWSVEPLDHQRHGGLIRMNIRDLVRAWDGGSKMNYGVLITMTELSAQDLGTSAANARLVVRYAFVK